MPPPGDRDEIERLRARLAVAEAVANAAHAFLNVGKDEDGFALDQVEYALLAEAVEAWEVVR